MDKEHVDEIIAEYVKKIFGFAISKTMNTDKAEELASRITFDVYISLLKADNVQNIAGYIFRIASNVYARFVDEEIKGRHISLNEVRMTCENDFTDELLKDETFIQLRRVISYLGRTQREIIMMYYFQKLKQNEIAKQLNIPLGTVKWHLHDARMNIKEGIKMMHEEGMLGVKPVRFCSMGHSGSSGPNCRDTSYYLEKLISQNIAYAAYHEAKTITEIAKELGIPAAFVEDEVACLKENGFMDEVPGGKYLTNIYITELVKETLELEHEIYTEYAKIVCDEYIPLLFDVVADYKTKKIYTPGDDFNFLMWSIVTYACGQKLSVNRENIDISKYNVKRNDGGEYIAMASLSNDFSLSYNSERYDFCGDMRRFSDIADSCLSWQLNTYYDDRRTGSWEDNLYSDYQYIYEFITGKITKEAAHVDKFKRLYDKGYLVTEGDSEYVNMIISAMSVKEFNAALPEIPMQLKAAGEELDTKIYTINKKHYPKHMQQLCRAWSSDCLSGSKMRTHVLEQLASNGTLKPLTREQKHSVNTILFCDILPK